MKKQTQVIRFFLLAGLLAISSIMAANNNVATANAKISSVSFKNFDDVFTYSWTAEPGAVSYVVEMVNTSTQESFDWDTALTSVTSYSIPSGTYHITVTAKFADNSSGIIIDDLIQH